jgi:purine-binding chemotaxis protein CheW
MHTPSEERSHEILQARARKLAQPRAQLEAQIQSLDITCFTLAGERYGFESRFIREIITTHQITPLPGVPPFIAGIMNLRGRILCLMTPSVLLGLPAATPQDGALVIVLASGAQEFGLLIESLDGVCRLPLDSLQEQLPTLSEQGRRYLQGIGPQQLIVLDAQALLHDPGLRIEDNID